MKYKKKKGGKISVMMKKYLNILVFFDFNRAFIIIRNTIIILNKTRVLKIVPESIRKKLV